jgi:hypothetical protein
MRWYSEHSYDGITLKTSLPKGGPYTKPLDGYHHTSYLVFYSQIINDSSADKDIILEFCADQVEIPDSPGMYVKVFLPPDTMSLEKHDEFSYGITELESFAQPTSFEKNLAPGEECLVYMIALFYQAEPGEWIQNRGGNRAELILQGQKFYFNMLPQISQLECGRID